MNDKRVRLPDVRGQNVGSLFANEIKNYMNNCKKPQLVLCILPSNDKTAYSIIKKTCCIEFFVPSQVITEKILGFFLFFIILRNSNLRKLITKDENKIGKTKSVITKVAIQMNCKLGGEAWGLFIPVRFKFFLSLELLN